MLFAFRVVVGLRYRFQYARERWQPAAVFAREVRAAEERSTVRCHEDCHRPAAVSGHGLHCGHVDGVDVWSLFTVDLDADEEAVHQRGDLFVLERFALHDVAPVARGVADAEHDGPVS